MTTLVVALRGLQAFSKTMTSKRRQELEKDIKSLVVIERRELLVCPLADRYPGIHHRYPSLQGQGCVAQCESAADGDKTTATKLELDGNEGALPLVVGNQGHLPSLDGSQGNQGKWQGKPQKTRYALDVTHGLVEHHAGEGEEFRCASNSSRGKVIRLFTTDVQFTDKKQISCTLAKIVLQRANRCDSISIEAVDKESRDALKEYRELSQNLQWFMGSVQMPSDVIDEAHLSQMLRPSLISFGANADEETPWVEMRPEASGCSPTSGHQGEHKRGSKNESDHVPNLHKLLFERPVALQRDSSSLGVPRDDVPADEDVQKGEGIGQAISRALEKREQEKRQRMEDAGFTETPLPKFERHLPDFLARRSHGENEAASFAQRAASGESGSPETAGAASHSYPHTFSNAPSQFSMDRDQPGSISGGNIVPRAASAFLPENPALKLQDGDVWVYAVINDDGPSTWDAVTSAADLVSEADLKFIGKWGEQIAFKVFTEQAIFQDILWVNSEEESGEPYDITLHLKDNPHEKTFVEVKTTLGNSKNCHISWNELNFAREKGPNYWVCRVIRDKISVEADKSVTFNTHVVVYKNLHARLCHSQASLLLNLA